MRLDILPSDRGPGYEAFVLALVALVCVCHATAQTVPSVAATPVRPAELLPLSSVRLLDSPFTAAVAANRVYLLELDPDRLLAPFRREAGLEPRKPSYGNWESSGLDGHTAGHYLSALATMIASGHDTGDGELRRRLDYTIGELQICQNANGDGYIGGVPGSHALWLAVKAGRVGEIGKKWVPWYNVHKTFAGLRDAYLMTGNQKARALLIALGDWCEGLTSGLSDQQMQQMLGIEHGGMNEVLADIYAISGDEKYLRLAGRFCHEAVLAPLREHQDRLTGLHANTQIPKVIGMERIAALTGDSKALSGAHFFWENVTTKRTVAFGGNSVAEHFNDPKDFRRMLEHREGPETCNTYNMLRLTEALFAAGPRAAYADFYERALYNHILASIHPVNPGFVYFTSIRPGHYRVYSQPDKCFWCCVGTGIENPGRYGQFIYAATKDGLYVNLFIASELKAPNLGLTMEQQTKFPDEPRTRLVLKLQKPARFTLNIRHPGWVATNDFVISVNGKRVPVSTSAPSSYAALNREWRDGDYVEVKLPMRTEVERLPDGSDWVAILRGPIVLASPAGTNELVGLRANDARMGHVAHGAVLPLHERPVLLANPDTLAAHIVADEAPLSFRVREVVAPAVQGGLPLMPFFRLHDQRYQMYWRLTTKASLEVQREQIAVTERAKAARDAATLDAVAPGEQQPEVEHGFSGEETRTGIHQGRRWRDGKWFQYTLNTRGEKAVALAVTYWGGDNNRTFDILANGKVLATESLEGQGGDSFIEKLYPIPADVLADASDGRIVIKFIARKWVAGGIYDVRLMRQ